MAGFAITIAPDQMTSDAVFTVTVTTNNTFKGTVHLSAQTDNGTPVQLDDDSLFLCPDDSEATMGGIGTVVTAGTLTVTGTGEGQTNSDQAELVV